MVNLPRAILRDYMDLIQCQGLVDYHASRNRRVDDRTDCWIYTAKSVNGSGYPLVKSVPSLQPPQGRKSEAFLLHRVSLVTRLGQDIFYEASHLCGVSLCFNPSHLVDEQHPVNESRKLCVGILVCGDHGHVIGDFCVHTPKCIRPPRDDLFCCLSIKESDPEGWTTQRRMSPMVGETATTSLHPVPQPPEVIALSSSSPLHEPIVRDNEVSESSDALMESQIPHSHSLHTLPLRSLSPQQPQSSSSSLLPPIPSDLFASVPLGLGPGSSARTHDPPTSPLSPERVRQRFRLDTSDNHEITRPESTPDESSSPVLPQRRVVRRPMTAPSTQHRQMMEDYFEQDTSQIVAGETQALSSEFQLDTGSDETNSER